MKSLLLVSTINSINLCPKPDEKCRVGGSNVLCGSNCPPCWIKHDASSWACYVYVNGKCPDWPGMIDQKTPPARCSKPEPSLPECPSMGKDTCLNHGVSNNVCKGGYGCPSCWIHHTDKNWACYNPNSKGICPWPNAMVDTSREGGKCNMKPPKKLPKCPNVEKDGCLNHGEAGNRCSDGLRCPPCWIHHTDNKNWACYSKDKLGNCPWPDFMVDTSKNKCSANPSPSPPVSSPEPSKDCPQPLDDGCLNHGDSKSVCKLAYKCPPCWIRHTDKKTWACYSKDKLGNCPWPKYMIDISKESEKCPEICPE